jgi:hypothetical protein
MLFQKTIANVQMPMAGGHLGVGWGWNDPFDEVLGRILEDACRIPIPVANDEPAGRQFGGRPLLLIPVAIHDPFAGRTRAGKIPDPLLELAAAVHVAQLDAGQTLATPEEVHIGKRLKRLGRRSIRICAVAGSTTQSAKVIFWSKRRGMDYPCIFRSPGEG